MDEKERYDLLHKTWDDIYKILEELGGAGATDEFSKGYDQAIDITIDEIDSYFNEVLKREMVRAKFMLKNNQEREEFIKNEDNWTLVFENDEMGIRGKKIELPNGAIMYKFQEKHWMFGDNYYSQVKYMLKEPDKQIDRTQTLRELVKYLSSHKNELEDVNL